MDINTQHLSEFYRINAKIATVQSHDKVVLPEILGKSVSVGMSFETVMSQTSSVAYKYDLVDSKSMRAWKKNYGRGVEI